MAQQPIGMEQLKQVLQLHRDGISIREIARRAGISRNSVRKYLLRLNAGIDCSDRELADQAYNNDVLELEAERLRQVINHFNATGAELSKTGVTRQLLWQEYLGEHPDGYSYSRYCYHLSGYLKNRDLSMHLEYEAADMIDNRSLSLMTLDCNHWRRKSGLHFYNYWKIGTERKVSSSLRNYPYQNGMNI